MKTVTSAQMREIERIAIEELGTPSTALMENAAIQVTKHCLRYLKNIDNAKVLIFCGPGNNGGDGLVVSRQLQCKGIETKVINFKDTIKQSDIEACDLIVDALLGTGISRDVDTNVKQLIEAINNSKKYVISVDIPSGVHSDTGRIMGCAVKADETITFGFAKTGLYLYPGAQHTGKIYIEDISIPKILIDRVNTKTEILTETEAFDLLPVRRERTNKGSFGKVFVFAGSKEMPGAAALACSAAYMTGAGLVCACVVSDVASVIHHWQREVVTRILPDKNGMYCKESFDYIKEEIDKAGVIVIGPGIGRSADVSEFVFELLKTAKTPMILDADALFAISENIDILKTLKAPCVITPHPGEMSRLTGLQVNKILEDTAGTALNFASENNVVTLLKDAHTIIASPDGRHNINITGNNSLSKAGTGDVLTGMIAGFIAQGNDVYNASVLGAYFHGKAAEESCLTKSNYGVMASDLINQLPVVMKK